MIYCCRPKSNFPPCSPPAERPSASPSPSPNVCDITPTTSIEAGSKTCTADISTPSPNDTLSSPPMVCATSAPSVPSRPKKRRLAAPVQEDPVELAIVSQLGKIGEVLSQRTASDQTTSQPDECSNFGQMIACQYRHLNPDQRPIFMQGIQKAYLEALTYQAPATDWRF